MNRFALAILTLAIALGGPASAGIINQDEPRARNIVAGQVSASGGIVRGSGFHVRMIQPGAYDITFDPRYFPSRCAAMVVAPMTTPVVAVVRHERHCNGEFQVNLYAVNGGFEGDDFMFIAREDAYP